MGEPAYRIYASWLDRVEREDREYSAAKLIVATPAIIYGLSADQMADRSVLDPKPAAPLPGARADLHSSATFCCRPVTPGAAYLKHWLPDSFLADAPPATTAASPFPRVAQPLCRKVSEHGAGAGPCDPRRFGRPHRHPKALHRQRAGGPEFGHCLTQSAQRVYCRVRTKTGQGVRLADSGHTALLRDGSADVPQGSRSSAP